MVERARFGADFAKGAKRSEEESLALKMQDRSGRSHTQTAEKGCLCSGKQRKGGRGKRRRRKTETLPTRRTGGDSGLGNLGAIGRDSHVTSKQTGLEGHSLLESAGEELDHRPESGISIIDPGQRGKKWVYRQHGWLKTSIRQNWGETTGKERSLTKRRCSSRKGKDQNCEK